ncbi:hypothetical protein LPJ61_006426 [Coemansia biformis]|uniref:Uncharacterized protein n=1 Tax=Coemansia biformis TaxID=1286918 RepID=A0A9W7XTV7_9FUNG|nr:hypothetical protein LPJ61_006426 [Coemansia biformis]
MHESSTPANPKVLRYTSSQEARETKSRRYRRILEKAKDEFTEGNVHVAERELQGIDCKTLCLKEYQEYVQARAWVWGILSTFYGFTTTATAKPL